MGGSTEFNVRRPAVQVGALHPHVQRVHPPPRAALFHVDGEGVERRAQALERLHRRLHRRRVAPGKHAAP
jgi:hypothetical protein